MMRIKAWQYAQTVYRLALSMGLKQLRQAVIISGGPLLGD